MCFGPLGLGFNYLSIFKVSCYGFCQRKKEDEALRERVREEEREKESGEGAVQLAAGSPSLFLAHTVERRPHIITFNN